VLIGLVAALSGCVRSLPEPVYKEEVWTVHLIAGCNEASSVIDTLRFQNDSFSINRTGGCLYVQAGRLFDLEAPRKYRMELDSPTTDYVSVQCGSVGDEFRDMSHFNWTVTLPKGKAKCHIWTQPNQRFDEADTHYTLDVNWTKVD
jgi:hypothetical protein